MVMQLETDTRIKICGSKKDIEAAQKALEDNGVDLLTLDEPAARLAIQSVIDEHRLKASILFNGNSVWSSIRIIRDVKKIKAQGMQAMSDYLYKFLSLTCGSIAHYNKNGWIEVYPTVGHLKQFFGKNEFGQRVKQHLPRWHTDAYVIVAKIENLLKV